MSLIYLASPYSHPDPQIRVERYWAAVRKTAELMKQGRHVFSPIAHTHEVGLLLGNDVDHEFWMKQDKAIIKHCASVAVLTIDGWSESRGVAEEIGIAQSLNMPVEYLAP